MQFSTSSTTAFLAVFSLVVLPALAKTDCDIQYPPSTVNTTYPSKNQICKVFANLEDPDANAVAFLATVSPTVNWTIEGTHPLAGTYLNRTTFAAALARIEATGSTQHPFELSIVNIIGGGEEEWSVEELQVQAVCKNGLVFDNRYSWVTRWDEHGIIVQVRAYLDSALVGAAIEQNEIGSLFTYSDLRDEIVPYVTLTEDELKPASGLMVEKESLA